MASPPRFAQYQYPNDVERLGAALLSLNERKLERERMARAEERQARLDQLAQEEMQRKARMDEDLYQIQLGKLQQQVAGETPLIPGGKVSIAPNKITLEEPPLPPELQPTGGMSPDELAVHEATGEPALPKTEIPTPGFEGQAPDFLPLGRTYKAKLSGGQEIPFPLQYKQEAEEEERRKMLMHPTIQAAMIRAASMQEKPTKTVERTVDLGNEVEYIYTDGTRETKPKGRVPVEARELSGVLVPLTDQTGSVVGFFNNRTGEFSPPTGLPEGVRRSGVPAAEMTQRGTLASVISDAEHLRELAAGPAGENIGPVAGRWKGATRGILGADQDTQDLFHIADNLADQLLRARSGAQINEQEYKRLRTLVPNPRDARSKFDADLDRFVIEANNILSARKGGPVSQERTVKPAETGGTPVVSTQEQYDALPSGATFQNPEGKRFRKP